MNAINVANDLSQTVYMSGGTIVTAPLRGADLTIGSGFKAESFRAQDIGNAMDPLVMVDHYVMTEPTFGAHPHAGMSAVSLLFEDSEGLLHNRDSLGNDFDLKPGDLYWLSAGRGAVHDESPRTNSRIHGLQVFVNVPQAQRFDSPKSRLVRSEDMPLIQSASSCVKIAMGESNGYRGMASLSTPMTILDGTIQAGGSFVHSSAANQGVWLQSIKGDIDVTVHETNRHLAPVQAIAMTSDDHFEITISNPSHESAHFVLFECASIGETYVQDGPFVMGSQKQIVEIRAAYKAGQLGTLQD